MLSLSNTETWSENRYSEILNANTDNQKRFVSNRGRSVFKYKTESPQTEVTTDKKKLDERDVEIKELKYKSESLQRNESTSLVTDTSVNIRGRYVVQKFLGDNWENEMKKIENERSKLVEKKFSCGLTENEEKRYKFLEWQSDRIEDAIIGEKLDQFESLVTQHEVLGKDMTKYAEDIKKILMNQ